MGKIWGLRKMLLYCGIIIFCLLVSIYYMNELKRSVDVFDIKSNVAKNVEL